MPADARKTERLALWARRAGWLVALWVAGVLAVGALALALRAVMGWIGLRL
ncbi:MAG: DUF2474 family protein [Burkholderiales bacterium]